MKTRIEKRISIRQGREVRLDKYVLGLGLGFSRSKIQKLINDNCVLIDGKSVKAHHSVHSGEVLTIVCEKKKPSGIKAENIPIEIVYEDSSVVVVNKRVGMVVHPARGNLTGTLVNALLYHTSRELAETDDISRPGVIHRLDKDTSGLIVFAKTERAHALLGKQVQDRMMKRVYLLLVWGMVPTNKGIIEAPIGRNTVDRKKMKVTPFQSRKAVTHYRIIQRFSIATYIRAQLETGRTHQIRVHFLHMGYPVVGDPDYGGRKVSILVNVGKQNREQFDHILKKLKRQALHATALSFEHPEKKKTMTFYSPLPVDIKETISFLQRNCEAS